MTPFDRAALEVHLASAILTARPTAPLAWVVDMADALVARMVRDADAIVWRRRYRVGDVRALSVGSDVPS